MDNLQSRGGKYKAGGRKSSRNKPNVILGLDDALISAFCSYVLSDNANIHKTSLTNLLKLITIIKPETFENNPLLLQKYKFLSLALDARVNKGLTKELILSDISREMNVDALMQSGFIRDLSNEEIEYVEQSSSDFLNNMVFDSHIKQLMNLCSSYNTSDFREKNNVLKNVRTEITDLMTEFRKNDVVLETASTRFRLSHIKDSIDEIHKYIADPSYMLVTGMQGFNGLLGGGFQKTRLYCLFSLAGEGKTVTLVNLLYQTWKYNKGFHTKDPNKKACIILLTMENLVIEYICSLFHVITRGKNIKNYESAEAVLEEFKNRKFEYAGENDIEIVIDYKPVNTKDTRYMYEIVEELEEEGFETIAFFMDYLMRIRPSEYTKDPYMDLGTVSNDFKTFAILKDIPVITASQLNREAAKIIDEGRNSKQADLIKKLGRATIGDSINIDRNIDSSIILIPEIGPQNERYMGFKLTKARYELFTEIKNIYQPIYPESFIAFVEDLYDIKPAFKTSLVRPEEEQIADMIGTNITRVGVQNSLRSLRDMAEKKMDPILSRFVEPDKKEEMYSIPVENLVSKDVGNTKPVYREVVTIVPLEERKMINR